MSSETSINSSFSFTVPQRLTPSAAGTRRDYAITLLAVLIIGVAAAGAAYGITGRVPLPTDYKEFFVLSPNDSIAVICSSSAVGFGGVFILYIYFRSQPRYYAPLPPVTFKSIQTALGNIKDFNVHFSVVKIFLDKGYEGYKDYYAFYHHLSSITQAVIQEGDEEKTAAWHSFLKAIDDKSISRRDLKSVIRIDCGVELDRLEGVTIETEVSDFKLPEQRPYPKKFMNEIRQLNVICKDAFPNWDYTDDMCVYYFFHEGRKPKIIRNAETDRVLGAVVFEEKTDGPDTSLFFHTLARKANTVKMGLAQKLLEEEFGKEYSSIYCHVRKENDAAQAVYARLGFVSNECDTEELREIAIQMVKNLNTRK